MHIQGLLLTGAVAALCMGCTNLLPCCPVGDMVGQFNYCAICCADGSKVGNVDECSEHGGSDDGGSLFDGFTLDTFCEDVEWILTNSQVYSYGTLPLPEMPPVCTWVHSYGATDRMGDDWTRSQAPVTEVMSGQYPDVGLFVDFITESSFGPFDGTDAYVPTNGFGARVCPAPFERLWSWDPNEHARVIDSNTASASIWQDISVSQMHNDHQYMMVFWLGQRYPPDGLIGAPGHGEIGHPGNALLEMGGIGAAPLFVGAMEARTNPAVVFNFAIFDALTERSQFVRVWWSFLPRVQPYGPMHLEYWRDDDDFQHPQPVGSICTGIYDTRMSPPAECQHMEWSAGRGLNLDCSASGEAHVMGGVLGFNLRP